MRSASRQTGDCAIRLNPADFCAPHRVFRLLHERKDRTPPVAAALDEFDLDLGNEAARRPNRSHGRTVRQAEI